MDNNIFHGEKSTQKGGMKVLKYGILGLLNYQDMTGYEVMEVFRDSLRFFWSAQTSQIYRDLQGMEKKGWVSKTVVSQQGKPDKNIYAITEKGKEELLSWLGDEKPGFTTKVPVLMKVFFMGERSREESIAYFKKLKEEGEWALKELEIVPQYINAYAQYIDQSEKTAYWEMTVDYGRRRMQMQVDWAQNCIDRLEEIQ